MIDKKYYNPYLLINIKEHLTAAKQPLTIDDLIFIINTDKLNDLQLKNLRLRIYHTLRVLIKNNNIERSRQKTAKGTAFYYQIKINNL